MLLISLSLLLMASAIPRILGFSSDLTHSDKYQWIAPNVTDVRSPCPGLNTLANHGFLPRNGKNITIPMVLGAALDGFNFHPETILLAAKLALLTGDDHTTFNLDRLALHNVIEADASLSRNDAAIGDNLHFNETTFSTLANANPGVDYYNITSAVQVQQDRLADSIANNPNVTNTLKEFSFRSGASALYLSAMGDPVTGVAPKNFVQIFFREERMPIAEGWKRSTTPTTGETLASIQGAIMAASKWTPTQACEPIVLGPGIVL
ncbi:putative Cloroperoxidase [Mycena venus]|uniref:Putative Cloroperoxidase n=1 Tax=Mycena venus TaxID=2733690 RepID=A0A8H7DCV2_9AGAR|nr:putative Cloroperoxidase [Mycena venus]